MACPAGLIWQQSQKMCNYAPAAEEPEAETLLAEVEGQACRQKDPNVVCPKLNSKRAYYKDRCDATKFFQCQQVGEEWVGHHMSCAAGTVWSQSTRACVHPEAEETEKQVEQTRELGIPEPKVDSQGIPCKPLLNPNFACVTVGRKGYYPHLCSRSLYHQCQATPNGWIAHVMPCAPGTVWSQRQQTCVAENQLKEMEKAAVEVEEEESDMCKPRNPNRVCPKKAYYRDRCDAARFYQCQELADGTWTAFPINCAPGTVWSQPQRTCVHPEPETEKREVDAQGLPCKPFVPPQIACVTIGRSGYYPHICDL